MKTTKNDNKVSIIFSLMERLAKGEALSPMDKRIQNEFSINERSLRRYLEDIYLKYRDIVVTEKVYNENISKRAVIAYKVPDKERDVSRVLKFFMEHSDDLGWLLQLVNENDPSLLKNDNLEKSFKYRLEQTIKRDKNIFLIIGTPFENLGNPTLKRYIRELKIAVKNMEYRRIVHFHRGKKTEENLKCLRLVFVDNNWYLASENENEEFRFVRLVFIESIDYAKNKNGSIMTTYPSHTIQKYQNFFSSIQNAMTLHAPSKRAVLIASPIISHYFDRGMKPFFPSQKYIETKDDGSIVFSIDYTQPLEILPFIKRWAPDITISEPKSLIDIMIEDMQKAVERHESIVEEKYE